MSMDPSSLANDVLTTVIQSTAVAGITAVLAWICGPLKWFWRNRNLRRLLSNGRTFRFTYNPASDDEWKYLSFLKDGTVGEGQNQNEHTWRIRRGTLEILADNGAIFSRFRHDKDCGQLKHTNDSELPSVHGQFLAPFIGPKCKDRC